MRLPCVFLSVLMEEMDSRFAPQKYPNEAGAHLARGMAEGQRGGSPIPFIYSGAAVDAGALRLSIAGDSLTGLAGSKVLPKMSHDGLAGTQRRQKVA